MKNLGRFALAAALVFAAAAFQHWNSVKAAGGPMQAGSGPYRVLAPIESGNLLLFPVVRGRWKIHRGNPVPHPRRRPEERRGGSDRSRPALRGLVRPRNGGNPQAPDNAYRGDEVNTLVLVNHSKRPLLLLAGEIVTGGKQDRIIAKDRIVPADADPIDLSVFCIEPGRWTGEFATFGASAKSAAKSFMVQPEVRERAMAEQDQQQVWNSVNGAISQMEVAASAPPAGAAGGREFGRGAGAPRALDTTSYAKAIQDAAVSQRVDEAAAPVMNAARAGAGRSCASEHAVGVVVAVRGEIIWADLFAITDLLSRYWTKLVRSYAAESLTEGENHAAPSVADAQHFLDAPSAGHRKQRGRGGRLPLSRAQERRRGDLRAGIAPARHGLRRSHQQDETARRGEPDRQTATGLRTTDPSPGRLSP